MSLPIPSYDDICPHGPDDLDAHWAAKNFLHLDRAQACALMQERGLQCYCEDLASMGIDAFAYYQYAIQDYLNLTYEQQKNDADSGYYYLEEYDDFRSILVLRQINFGTEIYHKLKDKTCLIAMLDFCIHTASQELSELTAFTIPTQKEITKMIDYFSEYRKNNV